ncbi:MAG: cell division protein FtsZ [Flavobacteriales bacterium]|nr:cell division protein FtsZ [Flavobacteriales bacterium]
MELNLNEEPIKFNLPKEQSSIIKVIGVGGGGSNAVNHMYRQGIKGVDFVICNTDSQALEMSPIPNKIQLGKNLTEGRGAGAIPEVGRKSALENIEEIRKILSNNTKMVFVTAGMGGGTGTGAAPIIAKLAREMGILTVGIVTVPFTFEGKRRREQAEEGIEELKRNVDTLLVISNDKLREIYGNLSLTNAFSKADDILTTAAKGISEIITVTGYINVDFEDVKTVMTNGGAAIMGRGTAEGENRALRAIEAALTSPLLNDSDIRGAKHILLYMTFGNEEISMDEMGEITDYIQQVAGTTEHMIFGTGYDETLGNKIGVTLIATGFKSLTDVNYTLTSNQPQKVVLEVVDKKQDEIIEAINEEKFAPIAEETSDFFIQPEDPSFDNDKLSPNQIEFKVEEKPIANTPVSSSQNNVERYTLFDDEKDVEKQLNDFNLYSPVEKNEADSLNKDEEKGILFKPNERLQRLKDISMKLKTPSGLKDLENEPAFKRRNVKLEDSASLHDNEASRLSISADKEEGYKLRENNSFLHDSVD